MRVPLSWMRDFVDIDRPVDEVAALLTNAGLEVKTIDLIGLPGADLEWDREKIRLGHILEVAPHPDADRLVLATVAYGGDEPEVTVTGAPNLFAYVGQGDISHLGLFSPFALEGAVLYDGHKPGRQKSRLKGRALRGIYNRCMLCSEKELGISDHHEGIIIMQRHEYAPDYRAGAPVQDVLGDAVLEIDIIPNIARCASVLGVAREYAALTDQPVRPLDDEVVMEGPPVADRVQITTANPALNPRFVALLIEGITQQPSPYWMQHRLRLAGQRPISVAVDISNYVMLEMGQPNHAFDYDFLRRRADQYAPDGPVHIHTRLPHEGETLTTLDGEVHQLQPYNILVTDPLGNLSLGGVMGGLDSEIRPETTSVLLEAAAWDFINIRRTSTRLGVHTDAAFRFSRGVHPSQALPGARRAAELMRRLAGGRVAQGTVDTYPAPPPPVQVRLGLAHARRLSGLSLSGEEMASLLRRLSFTVEVAPDHLLATAPDYRLDIEGEHDVVEEICRVYGYDRIPSTMLAEPLPPQRGNPGLEQEERIKDLLVQAGLHETITFRLTSPESEARLWLGDPERAREELAGYVTITNPISQERSVMRHSVLSSLLEVAGDNSRYLERITLFEVGKVYIDQPDSLLPAERPTLALLMTGQRQPGHWQNDVPPQLDFYDLKGVLEQLAAGLHVALTFAAHPHPTYRPGRVAGLYLGESLIGFMGEVHPLVVAEYGHRLAAGQPVLGAELDLSQLIAAIPFAYPYQPVSAYPAVREDLALIVDQALPAATVAAALREAGGFLLREVTLFDVYVGPQIPAGQKSLAYHLTFQAPTKTLSDREVSRQRQRILQQLERRLGARLRE